MNMGYLSIYLCHLQFLPSVSYRSFTFLVKFIPKCFVVFDAIINGVVFFIFQIDLNFLRAGLFSIIFALEEDEIFVFIL